MAVPGRVGHTVLSRGMRYMVAGAFFFSIMSLLVKLAGQRLPTQEIVFARSLVMGVVCWALLRQAAVPPGGVRRRLLLLRALFGFGSLSCFYYAVVHLPLADATVIQYTNALFTSLFAVFFLHERMRRREMLCLALALAGVIIVTRPSFLFADGARLPGVPVLVALCGAVCSGAAYVTVRRLEGEHPMVVILYFSVLSVVASAPTVALTGVLPGWHELLLLIAVGLTTLGGQLCLTRGLYLERAGRASSTGLIQIVFAAVLGIIFFREVPDALALTGSALIVGSILALGLSGKALAPVPGSPSIPADSP